MPDKDTLDKIRNGDNISSSDTHKGDNTANTRAVNESLIEKNYSYDKANDKPNDKDTSEN